MKYVTVGRLFSSVTHDTVIDFGIINGFRIRSSNNSSLCFYNTNLYLSERCIASSLKKDHGKNKT